MNEIKIGTLISYITIAATFCVGIIYTPILIKLLGQTEFGIYSLILAFITFMSLLDLGIGNTIVRFISRNRENGNKKKETLLLGQFMKIFVFLGCLVLVVGLVVFFNFEKFYNESLSPDYLKIAKNMILIATINLSISFPLNIYISVIQAYEKFIIFKLLHLMRTILTPIISIVLLIYFDLGLISTIIGIALVNISILIYAVYYAIKKLKISIVISSSIDSNLKKEIYKYSFIIFIAALADRFFWQSNQILIGIFKDANSIAIYAVAIQIIFIFASLSTAISNLFLPKLSIYTVNYTKENHDRINNIFNKVSKIQLFIVSFTLSGFIIFGKEFIVIWVGKGFEPAYTIVLILIIPFFVDLIQNLAFILMQAKGVYHVRAISMLICAIFNFIIAFPILKYSGIIELAISSAIFLGICNIVILNIFFHRNLKLNMFKFWKRTVKLSLPIVLLTFSAYYLNSYFPSNLNAIELVIKIVLYSIVFFILLLVMNFDFLISKIIRVKFNKY